MKSIKWLADLALNKPGVLNVVLLLMAVSALVGVVIDRNNKVDKFYDELQALRVEHRRTMDSMSAYYVRRESELINTIIENYKIQLDEQKQINSKINRTIRKNRGVIKKATSKIKILTE